MARPSDWTESNVTLLVEAWHELEMGPGTHRNGRGNISGGLDTKLAIRLLHQTGITRSARAIGAERSRLLRFVRFARAFDKGQNATGGRTWFDLTRQEQKRVKLDVEQRRSSSFLTRETFDMLMQIKSAVRRTESGAALISNNITTRAPPDHEPTSARKRWTANEVLDLVRAWGRAMEEFQIPVREFMKRRFDDSVKLYTPSDRSTIGSWRKMRSIVGSYQFIRAFNNQHGPSEWFDLSDAAHKARTEWGKLPPYFEDISKDVFNEVHSVDRYVTNSSTSTTRNTQCSQSVKKSRRARFPVNKPSTLQEKDEDKLSTPGEEDSIQPEDVVDKCSTELRSESPPFSPVTPSSDAMDVDDTVEVGEVGSPLPDGTTTTNPVHRREVDLKSEQFELAVHRLRVDIERELRRGADMVSSAFQDHPGESNSSGDATFVTKLLDTHRHRISDRFAQFQDEFFCDGS